MADGLGPTRQDLHDAVQNLYNLLDQAYWAASTIESKDRIRGIEDVLFDILTQLNRADIESRTQDYAALAKLVDASNRRLEKLKEDIDQIIHVVKVATDTASAID